MEWISVKERLPEKEQRILLYIEDRVYVGIFYDNNKFTTFEYDNCCNTRDPEFEKVTHWMPLPPYPISESVTHSYGDLVDMPLTMQDDGKEFIIKLIDLQYVLVTFNHIENKFKLIGSQEYVSKDKILFIYKVIRYTDSPKE